MTADDIAGAEIADAETRAAPVSLPGGDRCAAYPRLRIPCWPGLGSPGAWLIDVRLAGGSVPAQRTAS